MTLTDINPPRPQADHRADLETLTRRRVNVIRHGLQIHYSKAETANQVYLRDLETITAAGYRTVRTGQRNAVIDVLLDAVIMPLNETYYRK